jgi:hypothetical protein
MTGAVVAVDHVPAGALEHAWVRLTLVDIRVAEESSESRSTLTGNRPCTINTGRAIFARIAFALVHS